MLRFTLSLAVLLACACATPLERFNGQQKLVIDIPAGGGDAEPLESAETEIIQEPQPPQVKKTLAEEPTVRVIPVTLTRTESDESGSAEDAEVIRIPQRESDHDFFGIRFPLPSLFVYRRPVIRDPFSTFPGFQSFTPAQPSQFNVVNHMDSMMKRMQEQMSSLWSSILSPAQGQGFAGRPSFFERPLFPSIATADDNKKTQTDVVDLDKLPDNYSNSTSETKVIDGQVVEVNKTIHKVSSNDSSGFFHFQVIKIRPQSLENASTSSSPSEHSEPTQVTHEVAGSAPTSDTVAKPESDKEESESAQRPIIDSAAEAEAPPTTTSTIAHDEETNPSMNEIDGQRRETERLEIPDDDEVERFPYLLNRFKGIEYNVDDVETRKPTTSKNQNQNQREDDVDVDADADVNIADGRQLGKLVKLEEFDIVPQGHPLQRIERGDRFIDLSDDIRVNKILEEQNRKAQLKMVNPDVEIITL